VLGLGASGPQVIEGFHGVAYDAPIGRTREIIDICRKVWAREEPLVHDGAKYQLPLPEGQGAGLGKPLKIITHPRRPRIPIHVASLGPKNVQMTAELADGWLPILFHPAKAGDVWGPDLEVGFAKRSPDLGPMDVVAGGLLAIGSEDEVAGFRDFSRGMVALYVGGMGARERNFYNQLFQRYGYEAEAERIQDLYLDGKKGEAAAAVPDSFLEQTSLCGDEGYVRDRIAEFAAAGVTVLNVTPIAADLPAQQRLIETVRNLLP
jgi:F420-dependent oxidoreductase-like protein